MKVQVKIKQTVEYFAHVEMTKAQYYDWSSQLDDRSADQSRVAEAIIEKHGRSCGMRLGEPNDWGDLEVDEFYDIPKKPHRRTSNPGVSK
jgi:hypothetical protein